MPVGGSLEFGVKRHFPDGCTLGGASIDVQLPPQAFHDLSLRLRNVCHTFREMRGVALLAAPVLQSWPSPKRGF